MRITSFHVRSGTICFRRDDKYGTRCPYPGWDVPVFTSETLVLASVFLERRQPDRIAARVSNRIKKSRLPGSTLRLYSPHSALNNSIIRRDESKSYFTMYSVVTGAKDRPGKAIHIPNLETYTLISPISMEGKRNGFFHSIGSGSTIDGEIEPWKWLRNLHRVGILIRRSLITRL